MKKKALPFLILGIFVIAAAAAIILRTQDLNEQLLLEKKSGVNPAVGTYACGSDTDATYLVMDRDGSFCIYKQLADKAIDEGSYKNGPDNKYTMNSEAGGSYDAAPSENGIYLAGRNRTIVYFEKINDVPMYNNFTK